MSSPTRVIVRRTYGRAVEVHRGLHALGHAGEARGCRSSGAMTSRWSLAHSLGRSIGTSAKATSMKVGLMRRRVDSVNWRRDDADIIMTYVMKFPKETTMERALVMIALFKQYRA
jgi:hypothetical protein